MKLCENDNHSAIVIMCDKETGEVTALCSMTNDPKQVSHLAKEALVTLGNAGAGLPESQIN